YRSGSEEWDLLYFLSIIIPSLTWKNQISPGKSLTVSGSVVVIKVWVFVVKSFKSSFFLLSSNSEKTSSNNKRGGVLSSLAIKSTIAIFKARAAVRCWPWEP